MDSPIQERPSGASLHDQLSDRGWVSVPGLVAAEEAHEVDGALRRALGASTEPLLRVHSSEPEPHRRDAYGRIVNPVIHPGRLPGPQFAEVHGVEQRLVLGTPLLALATSLLRGPVRLLQSAWWESSRGSPWHRDHNPLVQGAPMLGVWLALQRIERAAGAFVVFDRSCSVARPEAVSVAHSLAPVGIPGPVAGNAFRRAIPRLQTTESSYPVPQPHLPTALRPRDLQPARRRSCPSPFSPPSRGGRRWCASSRRRD